MGGGEEGVEGGGITNFCVHTAIAIRPSCPSKLPTHNRTPTPCGNPSPPPTRDVGEQEGGDDAGPDEVGLLQQQGHGGKEQPHGADDLGWAGVGVGG